MKVALGILIRFGSQGIVNARRPTLFFEGIEHGLLRRRRHAVLLNHLFANVKHATCGTPSYRGGGRIARQW